MGLISTQGSSFFLEVGLSWVALLFRSFYMYIPRWHLTTRTHAVVQYRRQLTHIRTVFGEPCSELFQLYLPSLPGVHGSLGIPCDNPLLTVERCISLRLHRDTQHRQ